MDIIITKSPYTTDLSLIDGIKRWNSTAIPQYNGQHWMCLASIKTVTLIPCRYSC